MKTHRFRHAGAWRRTIAFCLACCLSFLCLPALATEDRQEEGIFVFPYEGFRLEAPDGARVLTQHNLAEHADFLATLGTDTATVLASMQSGGIVLMLFPASGGQIELAMVPATGIDISSDAAMQEGDRQALLAAYATMPRYQEVAFAEQAPNWLRMVFSAMQGDIPVFTLRYVTCAFGQQYTLSSVLINRAPEATDDALLLSLIQQLSFMSARSTPTPAPTPEPTPEPTPSPVPTPGPATRVDQVEGMTLNIDAPPAWVSIASLNITGTTEPGATVALRAADKTLDTAKAGKDGRFTLTGELPRQSGTYAVTIASALEGARSASVTYEVHFEMPKLTLTVTEPTEVVRRKESVIRGVTEPGTKVDVRTAGQAFNVRADDKGEFSFRIRLPKEGTYTYDMTASQSGWESTSLTWTVERALNQQEALTAFRAKLVPVIYKKLAADPMLYADKNASFRGRVAQIGDLDGVPCLLLYTESLGGGRWGNPIWALCETLPECEIGAAITAYVRYNGQSMPYTDDAGNTTQLPVAQLHFFDL